MALKLKSEQQFKILLESLWDELLRANTHFLIFNELRKNGKRSLDELNFAPAFWQFTFQAHIEATLARLIRVYDQHRAGFHLLRFLETVRANPSFFDPASVRQRLKNNTRLDADEVLREIGQISQHQLERDIFLASERDPLVKRLKEWRDDILAHKNPPHILSGKSYETDHPLLYSYIRILIRRGFRILNRYSMLFDANAYGVEYPKWNDIGFVLKALKYHPSVIRGRE